VGFRLAPFPHGRLVHLPTIRPRIPFQLPFSLFGRTDTCGRLPVEATPGQHGGFGKALRHPAGKAPKKGYDCVRVLSGKGFA